MTLQQLKYVVATAEKGTVSEAAQSLFISQPSLTNAIRELEKEMNITIFIRTNKGITVSKEGEVFLGYARQVLEQASLLEEKYCGKQHGKRQFCISTQHYSFAVNAFVELFSANPHVFVGSANPLAQKKSVTLDDLLPYPYLSFEQGEYNSFYYSEEILSTIKRPKNIRVRDRATLFNLLIGLNGYTICSGVIDEKLNGSDIVAVPLEAEGSMRIGIVTHKKVLSNPLTEFYINALKKYIGEETRLTT